jgi:adenine-specific DNA-methyltransferase
MPKSKKPIEQYEHKDKKRANNPPIGLVTPQTDKEIGKKTYAYDPHLDPQLVWAGKAEHTSFEIPTISLHVHERIDPRSIIEAVRKKNGNNYEQMSLFSQVRENPPLREAIDFYKHSHEWSNRLIAGDSLLVMNSLLEKEKLAGQVQMIYIDPPYGIKYGSNFQPFVNNRDVKDGSDEDLTAEPEMITAFRDTWELGVHSYLTYLRDRLLLANELLSEKGSLFIQIGHENVHFVRTLADEIFGEDNFCSEISFKANMGETTDLLPTANDYILWYAKSKKDITYHQLYKEKLAGEEGATQFTWVEIDGNRRRMNENEAADNSSLPKGSKIFRMGSVVSQGATQTGTYSFEYKGRAFYPGASRHWSTHKEGMKRLVELDRLMVIGNTLGYVYYLNDFPVYPLTNVWQDTVASGFSGAKIYAVQTNSKVIERCVLMTTDPGDLVLDITCGSGTTAFVAEQWGRRWITCDTSRVAITLAKQRLMTAVYDYYQLAHPQEGVGSGFKYKTALHITLKSIANDESPETETLYNQPVKDENRVRVSGPFTVEAVPSPTVKPLAEIETAIPADNSVTRSGETLRQSEWRDELLRTGIRGKGGQYIMFSRVEPLGGTHWLQADAETKGDNPQRVVISFGSQFMPLESKQVELSIEEARTLVPKPTIIVFAAFQFDPEAAKDIDETNWPGVSLLKAQMNADLLTEDLKKKRASNDSFWLVGQPDVIATKDADGKYKVEVNGFDYYNTKTGNVESGGTANIAMWMLDTDYDGRSLFPRQVFFPMSGEKDGWSRLSKNLKAEIDEDLIEAYRGTVSLPFEVGEHKQVAVKIVDDRGIESLKIIGVA